MSQNLKMAAPLLDSLSCDEQSSSVMAWTTPLYSKSQVDAAGKVLATPLEEIDDYNEVENALGIINNWRSSHSFPLNTLQMGLRRHAKKVDDQSLIAQRIKRLSSIELKLVRFPGMQLSRMQDIGGCRAIVRTVRHVDELADSYRKSDVKHKLSRTYDYIREPKDSGYRGIHLVYRYNSDKNETYNGLQIEMQLRSQLQHAWATAVETVGLFIRQALKSSQGEAEWLRFFSLMGTALAMREKTPPVPDTPATKVELVEELRHYVQLLDVEERLNAYGAALSAPETIAPDAHYFLLRLDPRAKHIDIMGFRANEMELASREYLRVEREVGEDASAEVVLVHVDSLTALRRAYPNYFLDTRAFIEAVRRAIH